MIDSNFIRLDLLWTHKKRLIQLKKQLRENSNFPNKNKIRRTHLRTHEAIHEELVESNYENSATVLRELIDSANQSINSNKFILNREMVEIIVKFLKQIEDARHNNLLEYELALYLKMALAFVDYNTDTFWLIEKLFILGINRAIQSTSPDAKFHEAQMRYELGNILMTIQMYDKALNEYEHARFIANIYVNSNVCESKCYVINFVI